MPVLIDAIDAPILRWASKASIGQPMGRPQPGRAGGKVMGQDPRPRIPPAGIRMESIFRRRSSMARFCRGSLPGEVNLGKILRVLPPQLS